MNYLQRFSLVLAALRPRPGDPDRVGEARRMAGSESDEWFSQIHVIARQLPPRRRGARD